MAGRFLNDWQQGRFKSIARALVVLAIISTVFTGFGAVDLLVRGDWWDYLLAAALAAASGIMIWAIWLVILRTAVEETSVLGRIGSFVKTLIATPAILTASTWLMTAGFANDSDKVHMLHALAIAEGYTEAVSKPAVAAGRLAPQVSRVAADLGRLSELEFRDGVSTGIPGPGAVVSALDLSSKQLFDLAREVEAALSNAAALRAEASDLIGKMRAVANSSASADQRWQEFGAHESAWRATVARIGAKHLLHSVVNGLEAASRDFGTVVALSQNKSIAAKQEAAITKYRVLITQQAGPIIAQARSLMAVTLPDAPVVERIGAAVAVVTYWQHNVAYWLLGIGIDLGVPMILLISIHVATATTTPRERWIARVRGVTTEERAAARASDFGLERLEIDHQTSHYINDALIGREPEAEQVRELTNTEPSDHAHRYRTGRIVLALVALAITAALTTGAIVYAIGGGSITIPGLTAPPPAQYEVEPGCTLMPNGIAVCEPDAARLTAPSDLSLGAGDGGILAAQKKSCVEKILPPRPEAVAMVDLIVESVGLVRNFDVHAGVFNDTCLAVAGVVNGKRVIVYDDERFHWEDGRARWSDVGIVAHEIAHLLLSHWMDGGSRPPTELEADQFSGYSQGQLGASLTQALSWTLLVGEAGGSTHPPRAARIKAVALGWGKAAIQMTSATLSSTWIGDEFRMAGQTCRLARLAGGRHSSARIACEQTGRWIWHD